MANSSFSHMPQEDAHDTHGVRSLKQHQVQGQVKHLLSLMSLEEKVGQLRMLDASDPHMVPALKDWIAQGKVGSLINQVDPHICEDLQAFARAHCPHGVPLLMARDVIHGFKTVFPIPLAQAATWDPALVEAAAHLSGQEASVHGVNWTFAPMIDISRDPRWGRIAESFGEDPYLTAIMGAAMVRGFQGEDISTPGRIAACAKHFAGYGASEGGRDYNTANIPENELRNIYLPPFKALVEAGVATFMPAFSDIDGLPATVNPLLMKDILRGEWGYDGVVVSDWDAIKELVVHGLSENEREAAALSADCRVDIEMASTAYEDNLPDLVRDGVISEALLDEMAGAVLQLKLTMGLFDPDQAPAYQSVTLATQNDRLEMARKTARASVVLLKNEAQVLPLDDAIHRSIAVIGPLADAPHDQMGTWVFDGDSALSQTPLAALRAHVQGTGEIHYAPGLNTSRTRTTDGFDEALKAAAASDVVIAIIGEEAILSGEAHCRADITLPGAQVALLEAVKALGKPVISVILAGRPLVIDSVAAASDAVLYAWHPGSMAGPALVDILFGRYGPSGRLPVTFPKSVGQVPIYYNHKRSGRPPVPSEIVLIDDIDAGAPQTSLGMTSFYLDDGHEPAYPFGFGLSYTQFDYAHLHLSAHDIAMGDRLEVSIEIANTGKHAGVETVQLYINDHAASLTRPVRELKAFQQVSLEPGAKTTVNFTLSETDLSFARRDKSFGAEPGRFSLWVGPNAAEGLQADFTLHPRAV